MRNFEEMFVAGGEYRAELEIEPGETQGWVCYKASKHGVEYSASLAALDATGVLTNSSFEEHVVPPEIIDEINKWAEEHGY